MTAQTALSNSTANVNSDHNIIYRLCSNSKKLDILKSEYFTGILHPWVGFT